MTDRTEKIMARRMAYRRMFLGDDGKLTQDGKTVLADLSKFCRLTESVTVISPVSRQVDVPATFQAEGRREVILRLLDHLDVDDSDLFQLTKKEAM
jgi:hypothetical protein